MRPLLTLRRVPVIRFRYDRPDQRGFSSCSVAIKSRKQFALRNSLKGDGREPSEQFYLTTELSNVVGTSYIFVTSFGRYPCRRWYAFSSGKFSVHRLRNSFSVPKFLFGTHMIHLQPLSIGCQFDSQITVICYGSVGRPFSFTAAWDSAVFRTITDIFCLLCELRCCNQFL